MKTLSKQSEDRILGALERVVSLVDDNGMHPTDAIVKIAGDEQFPPHFVTLMCRAYNNGRQEAQRTLSDTVLAKLASFPLADAREAMRALYPGHQEELAAKSAEVSSEYDRPPDWLGDMVRQKVAETDVFSLLGIDPAPPRQYSPQQQQWLKEGRAQEAFRTMSSLRDQAAHARCKLGEVTTRMHAAIDRLGAYFKRDLSRRIAFPEMQKVAEAYYGRAAVALLGHVRRMFHIRDKQAQDRYVTRPPVDHTRPPYTLLRECLQLGEEKVRAKRAFDAALKEYKSFVLAHEETLGLEPCWKDTDTLLPSRAKRANFLMGALSGAGLKDLFNVKATTESLVDPAKQDPADVFDPAHENEMRKIRMQGALAELVMSDEVLQGADPEAVETAYNELAELAPTIATYPGAIRPILRRRLQGALEPFEIKELLDAEQKARALDLNAIQGTSHLLGGK